MVLPRLAAISRRRLLAQKGSLLKRVPPHFPSVLYAQTQTHNTRMSSSSSSPTSNPLPVTFLRGGTSKGIFLKRSDLPADQESWDDIFLGIMGSPDAKYGRQLNGMGGGVSSLSKVMVVGPPTTQALKDQGVQCEYTFAQVGIRDEQVDYSGNCGNLTAVIGVFAVDEGLVAVGSQKVGSGGSKSREREAEATVRCYNTNTKKIVDTTFPVSAAGVPVLDLAEATIAGVPHSASRIVLDFINPAGAATGRLLPTSNPTDSLSVTLDGKNFSITASLVDATNPTVFVRLDALADPTGPALPMQEYIDGKPDALARVSPVLEDLRQAGAVQMGLDPDAQAQPKIALLSAPRAGADGADMDTDADKGVDIVVHALSMGVLHKAVPMTVGLCLGVAAKTRGTIAWDIAQERVQSRTGGKAEEEEGGAGSGSGSMVRLRHPGGVVDVGAEFDERSGEVKSAKVVRTGRRLMRGVVWY